MNLKTLKLTLCGVSALGVLVLAEPAFVQAQSSDPSAAAAAEIRFQQLEKEIRRLTGQIEQQNYEIRRLKEELARVSGDMDVRFRDLEQGGGTSYDSRPSVPYAAQGNNSAGQGQVLESEESNSSFQYQPPQKDDQTLGSYTQSPDTGNVSAGGDQASRAYDYAYSFIKNRDFGRAESEFSKFLNEYPAHPLAANAKYWYGETFYVRGQYEKSARIFAEGYQAYPKAPKAASNLLKLGMSLKGMGKPDDACVALKQLKKEYSASSAPVLKRADTEMKSINCT